MSGIVEEECINDIKKIEEEINGVGLEIKKVEEKIEGVEEEIKGVEIKLSDQSLTDKDIEYWRDEKIALRKDKDRLGEKQNNLIQKQSNLIQKQNAIINTQSNSEPLPRFKYDLKEDNNDKYLFPYNGIGKILLKREAFVNKLCDEILDPSKVEEVSCNHYFRSARGNGKTTFLKLLGKELENRNCEVYFFKHAKFLDDYKEKVFEQAQDEAKKTGKTLVIMVDEVQENIHSGHWSHLLKESKNKVVIGAGIPQLEGGSPDFKNKHSSSEMYFNHQSKDMEELIEVFMKETNNKNISHELISKICHYLCEYTGGHMYPLLKFCEHIFHENQQEHLDNYESYFISKNFYDHKDNDKVRKRCFPTLPDDSIVEVLRKGDNKSKHTKILDKIGYWDMVKKWFISKFLVDVIMNSIPGFDDLNNATDSYNNSTINDKIKKIFLGGLKCMETNDFQDYIGDNNNKVVKYENAIGFCWGWYIKCVFPKLFIASQVQVPGMHSTKGSKPCIDFVINGKHDLGIELIRDGNKKDCEEHANRFKDKYKRWKNHCAILNFIVTDIVKKSDLYTSSSVPTYHFVYSENALYLGETRIESNVAKIANPLSNDTSTVDIQNETTVITTTSSSSVNNNYNTRKRKRDNTNTDNNNNNKKKKNTANNNNNTVTNKKTKKTANKRTNKKTNNKK